ncbi:MAG: NHL repeat-containing protein [Candidatus Hodarchaeales archaeon]
MKQGQRIVTFMGLLGLISFSFLVTQGINYKLSVEQPIIIIGGTQGTAVGTEFNEPDAVAFSPEGFLFAGDTLNLRIQVYYPNGTYSHNITGFAEVPNNEVQGIAIDPEGFVRVIDMFGRKIKKFAQNGTFISEFGESGTGNGQFQEPQGIAIDKSNGDIYIVDTASSNVQKFSKDGTFIKKFGDGILDSPESILIAYDKVYVCSEGTNKIEVFTKDGNSVKSFGSGLWADDPEGITIDALGNILINNEGAGTIIVFDEDGTQLGSWGNGTGHGPGQFWSPDGIAYDYRLHRLAIADQGNYRIQIFDWYKALVEMGLYSDSKAPTISTPSDVSLEPGETANIQWTISDEGLNWNYSIYLDDVQQEWGYWLNGDIISYDIPSDLSKGSHILSIKVYDRPGNLATDSVTIEVGSEDVSMTTEQTTTSVPKTSTTSPYAFFGAILATGTLIVLKKKK